MIESKMQIMSVFTHKFWMGFNGFVLLFLAVNMATIGVELDSGFAFIIALGYLVYLFIYLSKSILWKLLVLFGIGAAGMLFYLIGIIFGLTTGSLLNLAWMQVVLSLVLLGGAFAHWKSDK